MKTVGSYEAKTHLPRLLEEVVKGGRITITRHGVPIALLVPVEADKKSEVKRAISSIKEMRKNLSLDGQSVREMIENGRGY